MKEYAEHELSTIFETFVNEDFCKIFGPQQNFSKMTISYLQRLKKRISCLKLHSWNKIFRLFLTKISARAEADQHLILDDLGILAILNFSVSNFLMNHFDGDIPEPFNNRPSYSKIIFEETNKILVSKNLKPLKEIKCM